MNWKSTNQQLSNQRQANPRLTHLYFLQRTKCAFICSGMSNIWSITVHILDASTPIMVPAAPLIIILNPGLFVHFLFFIKWCLAHLTSLVYTTRWSGFNPDSIRIGMLCKLLLSGFPSGLQAWKPPCKQFLIHALCLVMLLLFGLTNKSRHCSENGVKARYKSIWMVL